MFTDLLDLVVIFMGVMCFSPGVILYAGITRKARRISEVSIVSLIAVSALGLFFTATFYESIAAALYSPWGVFGTYVGVMIVIYLGCGHEALTHDTSE